MRKRKKDKHPEAERTFALDNWFTWSGDKLVQPPRPNQERLGRWLGARVVVLGAIALEVAMLDVFLHNGEEVKPLAHWVEQQLGSTGLLPPPPAS
jgi:hypothetical protein